MYAILMFCLLLSVKIPGTPPYGELNDCLERNTIWLEERNVEQRQYILKDINDYCRYEGDSDCAARKRQLFDAIDAHTLQVSMYLELLKKVTRQKFSHKDADSVYKLLSALNDHYINALDASEQYIYRNHELFQPPANTSANFYNYFKGLTVVGIQTFLSALQCHITMAHNAVVYKMWSRYMPGCVLHFDEIQAIAIPYADPAVAGQKVHAVIILASYNKAVNPDFKLSIGHITKVENGLADWAYSATDLGLQTVTGTATMPVNDTSVTKPWHFQYMVVAPGITIKQDKMNICYIGIPNPISISVPGYEADALSLRVPGASVIKTADGHYNIIVTKAGKLYALVDAVNARGRVSTVAGIELQVRPLPTPLLGIDTHDGAAITKEKLQHGQLTLYYDADMDIQCRFGSGEAVIISKERNTSYGPYTLNNAKLSSNAELLQALSSARPGDKLIISDIAATDNYGNAVNVNPAGFTIE